TIKAATSATGRPQRQLDGLEDLVQSWRPLLWERDPQQRRRTTSRRPQLLRAGDRSLHRARADDRTRQRPGRHRPGGQVFHKGPAIGQLRLLRGVRGRGLRRFVFQFFVLHNKPSLWKSRKVDRRSAALTYGGASA